MVRSILPAGLPCEACYNERMSGRHEACGPATASPFPSGGALPSSGARVGNGCPAGRVFGTVQQRS